MTINQGEGANPSCRVNRETSGSEALREQPIPVGNTGTPPPPALPWGSGQNRKERHLEARVIPALATAPSPDLEITSNSKTAAMST
jgi:hypothetical protein